jgi:hypothetical protein
MRPITFALVGLAVVGAACTAASDEASTTTTPPTTTITAAPAEDRLVILTADTTVVVLDRDLQEIASIAPPEGSSYRQPIWLDAETLLFSEVMTDGTGALIAADAASGAVAWRTEMSSSPFYFSPSPDGSTTTSLRNNTDGSGLIAELVSRGGDVSTLSDRSPFYSAWSPDGSSLSTHTGQRTLSVIEGEVTEVISDSTGNFQAPSWTSSGLFALRTTDQTQILAVWDGAEFTDLARIRGTVQFAASGGRVAIQSAADDDPTGIAAAFRAQVIPRIPAGRLILFDTASTSFEEVNPRFSPFFQWDPAGDRLLYAAFDEGPSLGLTWQVWENGDSEAFLPFTPQSGWFNEVVPFFDQYAQSLSLWSASGSAFAYPTAGDAGPIVVIQPIGGSPANEIEDAIWVSWRPAA